MPRKLPDATKKEAMIERMRAIRLPFFNHWRELADYYLPRRYVWLLNEQESARRISKNSYILDSTGTSAARTLASGMMNGITSPARPWFKLRVPTIPEEDQEIGAWLDEVERRMMFVMASSNFYNALAVMYLDLVIFGTAAMLVYEDYHSVIHCYNPALGEYFLGQDNRLRVNTFAREFNYTVQQCVTQFGIENVSDSVAMKYRQGGASLHENVKIVHLIEPNDPPIAGLARRFAFREIYWEAGQISKGILSLKGYNEIPGVFPRWEALGNDPYGSSPAMEALGDVIQLQHETKKKGQALDKLVSPPVVADIQLSHKPTALLPNGITYVHGINNVGVKPIYTVNPPLGEMTADLRDIQVRIRETFHNPLFNMISQLQTVRSAAEIDARREEKLVLLGPVLERFENEALDPAIARIFGIMMRNRLLPPPPEQLADHEIEVQYVSILSSAQTAVATAPIERFLQVVGNLAAAVPQVLDIPDFDELLLGYGRDIGVPSKGIRSREAIAQARQAREAPQVAQAAIQGGSELAGAAKQLSETDVGGGRNVLQEILGG